MSEQEKRFFLFADRFYLQKCLCEINYLKCNAGIVLQMFKTGENGSGMKLVYESGTVPLG
jgi:hypothetical protein